MKNRSRTLTLLLLPLVLVSCASEYAWEVPTAYSGEVAINGQALTEAQLDEFAAHYGAWPLAGRWWYDSTSGLFGPEGGAAAGFMYAGHDLGSMDSAASRGGSEVHVNGRRLPWGEVQAWSFLWGVQVMPGRYWFDAMGNVGVEGYPGALANLYSTCQVRFASGSGAGGGGGDNFWTSRFSAGNSNASNTQGYVSVPGIGPVGYGF